MPVNHARKAVALLLKQLRVGAGMDQPSAADALGFKNRHHLSYVERGRGWPTATELESMFALYKVNMLDQKAIRQLIEEGKSADRTWWDPYLGHMPKSLERLVDYESQAVRILTTASSAVPGLLQVREHTEALFAFDMPEGDDRDRSQALIEVRSRRGPALLGEPTLETLHAVVTEGVLRTEVGGRSGMRHQLDYLLQLAEEDHVTIQILPFSAGAATALCGTFSVLDFGEDHPTILHSDVGYGIAFEEKKEDVAKGIRWFNVLLEAALSPQESVSLLSEIRKELN